jgi:hypothetical protein
MGSGVMNGTFRLYTCENCWFVEVELNLGYLVENMSLSQDSRSEAQEPSPSGAADIYESPFLIELIPIFLSPIPTRLGSELLPPPSPHQHFPHLLSLS